MRRRRKDTLNVKRLESSFLSASDAQNQQQMDAFKLLMDSRMKVIGSNSPGKEREINPPEVQDYIDKKEIKAKRMLSLQKMAQVKGGLHLKEIQEQREMYIKEKMDKRAERLKTMITKNNIKSDKLDSHNTTLEIKQNKTSSQPHHNEDTVPNNRFDVSTANLTQSHTLTNDHTSTISNMIIPLEDVEFLKKLSPSLRKKENMLSYFKTITKDKCSTNDSDIESNHSMETSVIKVKLTCKKKKNKKLCFINHESSNVVSGFSREDGNDINYLQGLSKEYLSENNTKDQRKRKRKKYIESSKIRENAVIENVQTNEVRPKRNIRKPIKYVDEIQLSSSEEELHIFTPKKKKNFVNQCDLNEKNIENEKSEEGKNKMVENNGKHNCKLPSKIKKRLACDQVKKPSKLAPIFSLKAQVNSVALEAKQKFLHSGIPQQLKRSSKLSSILASHFNTFHTVVHVQQTAQNNLLAGRNCFTLTLPQVVYNDDSYMLNKVPGFFNSLLTIPSVDDKFIPQSKNNTKSILNNIKNEYSRFPVYRTYQLLNGKSKGEFRDTNYSELDNSIELIDGVTDIHYDNPDQLKWTDKYKPTSTKLLIGNFESIKELRKWLESWNEPEVTLKSDSTSSEFYQSDSDSGGVAKMRNNLLILTGPTGSGKTSSVYAVASELAIKVIEVNASSKRTGKIILQDLQEATQSHKVDRRRGSNELSQKQTEDNTLVKTKKCRPKKNKAKGLFKKSIIMTNEVNIDPLSSQESTKTGMSLILIDDADIVFDQDDGFCSAIAQLVQSSKRPVIIITESLHCPHLQKFIQCGKIIYMQAFLPRMLGTWLDIMCLVDNGSCYPGLGEPILDFFKGDIRKAINCLHFYITSQKYISKHNALIQESDWHDKPDIVDENSSMSWTINEDLEDLNSTTKVYSKNCFQYFLAKVCRNNSVASFSFNLWWSIPHLLNYSFNVSKRTKIKNKDNIKSNNKEKLDELEAVAMALDAFSVLDYLEQNKAAIEPDITSNPWCALESASLIDCENLKYYDRNIESRQDLTEHLITTSIEYAQKILQCEYKTDVHYPSLALQRDKEKVVKRHINLTSYLNTSAVLDHRAVALDYWPSCRAICRKEKMKTDTNSKRNNRFCHYLQSLNVRCKNDYFNQIASSLCPKDT